MDEKTYQEYWKMVRAIAREKADKKLGIGIRFLALGVVAVSTTIVSIFLGGNLMTTLTVALVTITVNVVVWIIVWVCFFVYYRAYEPVIIYNEKERKLESFKNE